MNPSDKLFTREAVLAIAIPIQPFLLSLRANEFAHALAITHVADRPFWNGTVFGAHYDISACAVMGLALSSRMKPNAPTAPAGPSPFCSSTSTA